MANIACMHTSFVTTLLAGLLGHTVGKPLFVWTMCSFRLVLVHK